MGVVRSPARRVRRRISRFAEADTAAVGLTTYIPARRANHIDPMVALRHD